MDGATSVRYLHIYRYRERVGEVKWHARSALVSGAEEDAVNRMQRLYLHGREEVTKILQLLAECNHPSAVLYPC
jgi:hypothetical protein